MEIEFISSCYTMTVKIECKRAKIGKSLKKKERAEMEVEFAKLIREAADKLPYKIAHER